MERALKDQANAHYAQVSQRFFRTGKGEYGEGDRFLGVRVPQVRRVVREHGKGAAMGDAVALVRSPWHEVRLAGCLLFVELQKRATREEDWRDQKAIADAYIEQARRINNWDLVDVSARDVLGPYVKHSGNITLLQRLAASPCLWERRIAVIASWAFIREGDSRITLALCRELLGDTHDLMHKACGWMLREVGKSCGLRALNAFLDAHAHRMPRTMLRYALEKHTPAARRRYMKQRIRSK
jgi:3-methyladenine DNA glycosylase AlkD